MTVYLADEVIFLIINNYKDYKQIKKKKQFILNSYFFNSKNIKMCKKDNSKSCLA